VSDDTVILEGGPRHGQSIPLSDMTHDGFDKYILHVQSGVYRHDDESFSDFVGGGQRVAEFEPFLAGVDDP
jgi:hypothetical protein